MRRQFDEERRQQLELAKRRQAEEQQARSRPPDSVIRVPLCNPKVDFNLGWNFSIQFGSTNLNLVDFAKGNPWVEVYLEAVKQRSPVSQ